MTILITCGKHLYDPCIISLRVEFLGEVLLYVRNTPDNEHNYLNKSRRIVATLHTFPVAVKSRCPVLYSFYLLLILFSSYPSGTDFYGMLITGKVWRVATMRLLLFK
jgi:hypothetical protein